MASANCWRCLARPSQRLLLAPVTLIAPPSTAAAFSTRAQQWAKASDAVPTRHVRTGKRLILGRKKRPVERGGKSPLPGERKAFRKRISLSNNNALEVQGLDKFSPVTAAMPESAGKMYAIPVDIIDHLRACEAFKSSQNWGLFRAPHVLVRRETVRLVKMVSEALDNKQTLRMIITGLRGSGKSILGLQALATGFMKDAVVINLPEGQDLTSASTEYAPIPNSEMFSQPVYTVKLMQAIQQTNFSVLSQHKIELDHLHLPISAPRSMTLAGLLNATKEPEFAWPVFQAFWQEILRPGRPPIVFNLDGLAHIMQMSAYRSPIFEQIHSHDLSLVRMFVDALSGKTPFVNGAAIIGITSGGNAPRLPSMAKAIAQLVAKHGGQKPPARDPFYRKYDQRVFDVLHDVEVLDVEGASKAEIRALMEYWAASGIFRARVDERQVTEKWTLSGSGVLSELERVALYDLRAA